MNKYFLLFILVNFLFGGLYLWGADHNRYVCAWLWFIIPMVDALFVGLLEHQMEE
jgi:hypothetical protein